MKYFSMFSGIGGFELGIKQAENNTKDVHGVAICPSLHGFEHGTHKNFNDILPKKLGLIRRLTPTECERLQGFPDGWTEGISDTQRYKCLGNAVTVNVIEAIAEKLLNTP